MTDITTVKQRFGIIGTSELLDRALEVAVRVAPTDLTAVSYTHLTLPTNSRV